MAFKISTKLENEIQRKVGDYILKNPKRLTKEFEDIKVRMISEFLNHKITKEINAGAYAENTSGTLLNLRYGGNLFSFIGFELGTDPIEPIMEVLKNIDIKLIRTSNSVAVSISKYPTAEDIWKITPMPWQEGRSWAKGIESGISGLNYYLFSSRLNDDVSRSSVAIQAKNQIRSSTRYLPTSYISTFLKKYKTIFSSKYAKNKNVFVNIEQQ